jgi:hypothetical protein
VISTGAAGVQLLPLVPRQSALWLRVAIDLNAVPPAGIEGIAPSDKGIEKQGQICYGALAVGSLKMKIHKAALRQLFESRERVIDSDEMYNLAKLLAHAS